MRADRAFFRADPSALAVRLIGCSLVRVLPSGVKLRGVVVETEAYIGEPDRAAHSWSGRKNSRNASMFAPPGISYVYFVYGKHHCFNVVCGEPGEPVAVLIRALEPVEGIDAMRALRTRTKSPRTPPRASDLCCGPANLCKAMAIDRGLDGVDLCESDAIWIEPGEAPAPASLTNTARVGIACAGEWAGAPLRWYRTGSLSVSRGKPSGPESQ